MTKDEKQYILSENYKIRGQFIDWFINIESNIDLYLSNYFAKNEKRNEFVINILDSRIIEFSEKVQIFKKVVSRGLSNDEKKFINDLINNINDLAEHRNALAHFKLDLDVNETDGFFLIKHNQTTGKYEHVKYDNELLNILGNKIKQTTEVVQSISLNNGQ